MNGRRNPWSFIPVDDRGYFDSGQLCSIPDAELRSLVLEMQATRYSLSGWRNAGNKWRNYLGLDSTVGKSVLDYGCGIGIEALQFAKTGNRVALADIFPSNLALASRVLGLFGFQPGQEILLEQDRASPIEGSFDIFYCNGVLHHIPHAREVLERAAESLRPGGEVA